MLEGPPIQPYQCTVCHSRFTRHENLKRHAALHTREPGGAALICDFCNATFSRPDLRLRHVKRKHPERAQEQGKSGQSPRRVIQRPSQNCKRRRTREDRTPTDSSSPEEYRSEFQYGSGNNRPEDVSQRADSPLFAGPLTHSRSLGESTYSQSTIQPPTLDPFQHVDGDASATSISPLSPFSTSLANFNFDPAIAGAFPSTQQQSQYAWTPSESQIAQGTHLFFTHVFHFVPFLHQPTFAVHNVADHLLASMLCVAYQHGEDPDRQYESGSGVVLSARCFDRARILITEEEHRTPESTDYVSMVQSYLLLQIYAMMYSPRPADSSYALQAHSKSISLARSGGLMQPILTESVPTEDLDSLWRRFVKAESHKRTLFAVHQIDATWYQFLSIPRSLSHLEIKHELPCPEDYWTASSSGAWAHRRLTAQYSGSSVQYPEAVRRLLSSSMDLMAIPAFDPYGAINLMQFLVSSAREVSGWSTMSGIVSIERLEPLRSSLLALGPFIRSQPDITPATNLALCEATWETAMIEMHMWSPSHTGGIVESSIDAVLHQLTYLASCSDSLCDHVTAKSVQPHIDWFLRYLDATVVPDSEAPWILLYAYKAFIIAWQLLREGREGVLEAIGVGDGDAEAALVWARKVFGRRDRWQLGKTIVTCLETLEKSLA
ncbi:fungal-specific transcription factor domain-containing protein [Lophiotrema nucula]|uniref:Fungal-specific transcription factor domain-containing protein n=1 Tax=Lophiotrema nucula TaxID=690887 RepID=A0A6A5ZW06_9PLEO|nr:fungal-specific transcription factor domain-containing protein [Lophiotrema nucula]